MATETPETFLNLDCLSLKNRLVEKTPLTQRRYTPYTKSNQRTQALTRTPLPSARQKLRKSAREPKHSSRQQRSASEPIDEKTEDISTRIVNKTWRVFRASPLYCFRTDAKSLKLYEKRLNNFLAVETCGDADTQSKVKKKSTFRKLNGDSENDYGVEIKIMTNEGKENAPKEEMVAVLCCGGCDQNLNGNLTSLPLCLMKSPVALQDRFHQWLENHFGCRVCPLLFSPTDLAWLVSLCAGIGQPSNCVEFTYSVPAIAPGLDTIYFKLEAKDARKIWNAIHDSKQPFFTNDEAVRFLKSMEAHFYHHFKVHLDQMRLTTVGTSVAYVGQEGRIKILQEAYVCYFLQQLSQLANF